MEIPWGCESSAPVHPGAEVSGSQEAQTGFYEPTLKVHERQNGHPL